MGNKIEIKKKISDEKKIVTNSNERMIEKIAIDKVIGKI